MPDNSRELGLGHYGTLDPPAAGVLPLAVGRATRLLPLIIDRSKKYAFTVVLGKTTVTGDSSGLTTATADVPDEAAAKIAAVIPKFIGRFKQVPPMVSAVHHNGKRLYEIARQGETVERTPRDVEVYALDILEAEPARIRMRIHCAEGFYVRSLCEDLAAAIGTLGHMDQLVREAAGPFTLADALTHEEIAHNPLAALIDPRVVIPLPVISVTGESRRRFSTGIQFAHNGDYQNGCKVFVADAEREDEPLLGFGEVAGAEVLPQRVFV